MTEEKPTPGNEGASIEDRLVSFLSAEKQPDPQPKAEEASKAAPEPETQAETPEPDKPDSDAPDEGSQPQLTTSDLAKVLGIDEEALIVNDDGSISVKSKIDGKEVAPKFADLIKSYQVQGHADNKSREVAERERALQARQQEVEQEFQQRLRHAEQLANIAAADLMREYQSIDWNALEAHPDRGAVADLKLKFQERGVKIRNVLQSITQQNQQDEAQKKHRAEQKAAKETERVAQLIPEWTKPDTYYKESAEILELAQKRGVTGEALEAITKGEFFDAGLLSLVRDALLYSKLQTSKVAVENKVRTAPKIVKPGQSAQVDAKTENLRNLKAQVSKTGGKNGTLEAFLIASGKV